MDLELYRVPAAVREGVTLTLPNTEASFRVRLPSQHNRPFSRAVQNAKFSDVKVTTDGNVEMGVINVPALRDQRISAFCDHCLIMPLPGGMTLEALQGDYYPALDWLFTDAERLAAELDQEAITAKKKSVNSSR